MVKLQLSGRVVDDQSLEVTYTEEELKAYYAPLPLLPAGVGAGGGAAPGADLAPESWMPARRVVSSTIILLYYVRGGPNRECRRGE